jgi:uncharacterized glyoxalase superfamily protein PhnB
MGRILSSDPVLAVPDLDRSADWFQRVLGCTVEHVDPGNWVFCRTGAVTFMLGKCPDALPVSEIGDHSYVAYVGVEGVDEIHRLALSQGAEILKPPTDEPWRRREIALRSVDGHRFMLGERRHTASDHVAARSG